jgi:hypothetical protein
VLLAIGGTVSTNARSERRIGFKACHRGEVQAAYGPSRNSAESIEIALHCGCLNQVQRALLLFVVEGDVIFADHFRNVPAGLEFPFAPASPRVGVGFRIIHSYIEMELVMSGAGESLDHV